MSEMNSRSDTTPNLIIKRGKRYNHDEHGPVKVTGIWKGVHQVDKARNADETGVIVVRYSTAQEDRSVDKNELTDTLDEFIAAIE